MLALQRCVSKTAATINRSLATAKKVNPRFLSSSLSAPSALQYPSTRGALPAGAELPQKSSMAVEGLLLDPQGLVGRSAKSSGSDLQQCCPLAFWWVFFFFLGHNHLFCVCN